MIEIIEEYNKTIRTTEDGTIRLLNRILNAGFNRLIRRTRFHIKAGIVDPAQRNLALLTEFRRLVPAFNPERIDAYDRLFRNLALEAGNRGIDLASALTGQMSPGRPRFDITLPFDATISAATQSRTYLQRHGETFAQAATESVAQGIAEGRPTADMVRDIQIRLNVLKSSAENIVRTEALRSYNNASDSYYSAQGIEFVVHYATADDRTCSVCAPRAGLTYRRGTIKSPLHPRCRCYEAPWDADLVAIDPNYAASRERHRREVLTAFRRTDQPVNLNKAAIFEQQAPVPI